jgi:L-aminopeptidase/D-esterase-like protein
MRWLEEREIGYLVTAGVVPIVPAACIYDFTVTEGALRPNADHGYKACAAATIDPVIVGSVGAGAGASVGKLLGADRCMRGGVGSAAEFTESGLAVGALVVVNSLGEIVNPDDGRTVAGIRGDAPGTFASSLDALRARPAQSPFAADNSTIAVVATDASLTRDQLLRVAVIAQTALARTIRPVHTPVDGDIVFALSTGSSEEPSDALQVGALAARALERAVLNAVTSATSFGDILAVADWYP